MIWLMTKYAITAFIVVVVSEFAKRSDKLGSLIASLPLVTLLTLIWLYMEKQGEAKIAKHAWYTFWYVTPTLPMFLIFPFLLPKLGFWLTLVVSILITLGCFSVFSIVLKIFGIDLSI